MRFLFVTWGVISWIGKGIVAASIGKLLKQAWHSVTLIKLDPYLQIDAGTMSPYEHGEVFVTQDGYETDLDLGHYERFLNQSLSRTSSITSWYIFQRIITKERRGDYLGETVQVVPHVTNEIKELLIQASAWADVTIVEVGGTIGDIEWPHFIEAIRQLRKDIGREHTMYVHVAPLLYLDYSGEVKTKPIQHSVRELTRLGIQPDMIICRTKVPLTSAIKEKISLFCDTEPQYVIEGKDAQSIYEVPQLLQDQEVDLLVQKRLWLDVHTADLTERNQRVSHFLHPTNTLNIGIIGKYAQLQDSYLSVIEALKHAGAAYITKIQLHRIQAEAFEDKAQRPKLCQELDGLVIPGWFGKRGMEGKILAAQFARENNMPFLGLCLGLQMAVIEYARHVCGLSDAHTIEAEPTCADPVISRMPGQSDTQEKWATMRLGAYTADLLPGSRVAELYQATQATERHRHRCEVNPAYYDLLTQKGLVLSWKDHTLWLVEYIELADHPFFVATQAHPEFLSRLDAPHPLFTGFVQAAQLRKNTTQ